MFSPTELVNKIKNLSFVNRGPLPQPVIAGLFAEIIAACNSIIKPLQVAYLGPEGSFCQMAALRYMGGSSQYKGFKSVVDIFEEVSRGGAQIGVVPGENSYESETDFTLDQFFAYDLNICGEVFVNINLHLMSLSQNISEITDIYINPLTLGQCNGWLKRNLPAARLHERAGITAALDSIKDKPWAAAVGSELAARQANMNILAQNIGDTPNSQTRFFILDS